MNLRCGGLKAGRRLFFVWVSALAPNVLTGSAIAAPSTQPAARVTGCEHFAFLRPSLAGGLGGPARQALKSWEGEKSACFGPDSSYYQIDQNNCVLIRVQDGQARLFAGEGIRGWRDGPADQAHFDFGVGSYSDCEPHCDAAGNVYVSTY